MGSYPAGWSQSAYDDHLNGPEPEPDEVVEHDFGTEREEIAPGFRVARCLNCGELATDAPASCRAKVAA